MKDLEKEKLEQISDISPKKSTKKTKKVGNNKESQQQEIKLKDQLNKIKVENDQLMNKIGEKDIKIQNLKECMDKFEEIKNKGNLQNYEEEVKKLNLDEILTEDDLDDKNNIKDDTNIKEKLGYIPLGGDLEEEEYIYTLPEGTEIKLGKQVSKCTELLFNPGENSDLRSIDDIVVSSLNKCDPDIKEDIKESICLIGGNTYLNNFRK